MKINSDYTAETTREEDGPEDEIKIHFYYQPEEGPDYEDGHMIYPGCEEYVQIEAVERWGVVSVNGAAEPTFGWVDFDEASESEEGNWRVEILEAIHKAGNEQ